MNNWTDLIPHGLWVTGFAIVLASFSYHQWLARQAGLPWREELASAAWQWTSSLGLMLVCAGWGWIEQRVIFTMLWTALGLYYGCRAGWIFWNRREP